MCDELTALLQNGTWDLIPPSPSQNVVGFKWIFRIKHNPDGSISRYKTRLVSKGFHQRLDIDFMIHSIRLSNLQLSDLYLLLLSPKVGFSTN